jgi:hypothetical protein
MTTQTRSAVNFETLQESLDAGGQGSNEQYETPPEFARELMSRLPVRHPSTIVDPQVAGGALVNCTNGFPVKYGVELDHNKTPGGVQVITGNCMKVFEAVDELMPDLRFVVGNCNPPFGISWKLAGNDGKRIDSTLATWNFIKAHADQGFFIANASTIEKFGIHQDESVEIKSYERRKANQYWKGLRDTLEIGIVIWHRHDANTGKVTPPGILSAFWQKLKGIIDEEKLLRPKFNIFLDQAGFLKTYLSQRNTFKLKLTPEQVQRLQRIDKCHPLTLTTEKETRDLMRDLVDCGLYSIEPAAKEAVQKALAEVRGVACPIMPVSEFETVAYTEEEDALVCHTSVNGLVGEMLVSLTAGKSYQLTTGTYKFTETFKRDKAHYNETTKQTYSATHDCVLSGNDRYIEITDNNGQVIRFMDRPRKELKNELPETKLWDYFTKPFVETVTEVCKEAVNTNASILKAIEMLAGYEYYDGQTTYLSRMAVKDCCLAAGETGTGKSLMAISLLAMKSPQRALIIAPQGTMRASKVDEEDEEGSVAESMSASQWLKELNKFAPYLQVWEIFSYDDYQRILSLNDGQLPMGVFVTYYEAFFSNGAKESCPASWDDDMLNQYVKSKGLAPLELQKDSMGATNKHHWCDSLGKEVQGVRCILEPCLATLIGHHFDCVIVDEAHKCKSLDATITQMLIRLQPKYRFALTATPIFNVVSDIFPLMGWLAVPEWYKGNRRNAAWPYAREDLGRFTGTFLTQERDLTEEEWKRKSDPKWKGQCVKNSPIISSPARLLKLLKPNMAFISKEQCRADYIKPKIIDVRVPMGREQAVLYGHFTNRANVPAPNAYVRAGKQVAYLRNICADPAGFSANPRFGHGSPKVRSNLNPKVIAILELTRDILARGEQVVIINSRIGLTDTIEQKLAEIGVPIARIDSTMSAEQHAYQANLFKLGRARIMFMGIKSAAAYSFDNCQNLIIGSLEYTWGNFAQAVGRVDRVTNRIVKNIYVILHRNSIEEVQYDAVAVKGDAAALCLRGKRIPRDFKPVDGSEILAAALKRFDLSGATPESDCESNWPALRKNLAAALATGNAIINRNN